MGLQPTFGTRTINELTLMFRNRQINLEPGFQRQSVWTWSDRRRLVQSIIAGYPVPSIFLYKREHNGRLVYDVIDGKQRIETIFMFTRAGRFKRDAFDVKLEMDDGPEWMNWNDIRRKKRNLRSAIDAYSLQTVEVTGDLNQIIDLFVRINSTGKRLTSGEKRHARFYNSPFLKEAERLVSKGRKYLEQTRILTPAQVDRMKGTELFAELLMSITKGGPINKKTSLDRAIGNDPVNGNTLGRVSREFTATLNLIRRALPDLKQIRFRNSAEFYSLFLLFWEMNKNGLVFSDRRRNRIAFELLKRLSTGVDELRSQLRQVKPVRPGQRIFGDYLLTVQGDTDSSANRERRGEIIRRLLWNLYERKHAKRTFSAEQRRVIWHSDDQKRCAGTKCHHKKLTWDDFTVDHVKAWSRGGATSIQNAALMCRSCNSKKGARPARMGRRRKRGVVGR